MASFAKKHPENVPGPFFVDAECIDCDLCRQTAPRFFKRKVIGGEGYSYLYAQPETPDEISNCQDALSGCPVEAIGHDPVITTPVESFQRSSLEAA